MSQSYDAGRYFASGGGFPGAGAPPAFAQARPAPDRRSKPTLRRNIILLVVLGALLVGIVLGVASLLRSGTTLTVQISGQAAARVDLAQSFPLSPYLNGTNVFPLTGTSARDASGPGFMDYNVPVLSGLRSAGVKLLRFPGGNWDEEHSPSTTQLDAFSSLLTQTGADGLMQVPLSDPLDEVPVSLNMRATRAALLVDYLNNKASIQRAAKAPFHAVKYWSVGNEPDLLTNPDTGKPYTVAQYTQAFIAYSLAMHKKDPSIQVFGPEISTFNAKGGPRDTNGVFWMQGFLQGIASYERTHSLPFRLLDGVSLHYYPFTDGQHDQGTILLNPPLWSTLVANLRQMIRQTLQADLPVAVTEINTNPGKQPPPQQVAALWWAETLSQLAQNQVEFVAFFSTEGVESPTPLFLQKGQSETAMLRVMQLYSHMQANLVPVPTSQGPVSLLATQDNGHGTVSLFLVNQSSSNQEISIQSGGALPWSSWPGPHVTLAAGSMAVLTLHSGGGAELDSFVNPASSQQSAPAVQHVACNSSC